MSDMPDVRRTPVELRGLIHLYSPWAPRLTFCEQTTESGWAGWPTDLDAMVTCLMCLTRWDVWAAYYRSDRR